MNASQLQRPGARVAGAAATTLVACLAGCSFAAPSIPEMADELNATLQEDFFLVRPGDMISVTLPNNPEWNQQVGVRPDGGASFLFIGDLEIEGLARDELEQRITEAYEQALKLPDITVDVLNRGARSASILGEVRAPGIVNFRDREVSLVDALAQRGGPRWERALLKRTLLVRWFPKEKRREGWTIDARIKHWDTPKALWLQPNDIVYVPPKNIVRLNNWIDQYIRRLLPFPYVFPTQSLL